MAAVDMSIVVEGLTSEQLLGAVELLARAKVTKGQRARNRDIAAVMKLLGEESDRRQKSATAWARAVVDAERALQVPAGAPAPEVEEVDVETGKVRADQLQPGDRLLEVSHAKLDLESISLDLPLRIESASRPDKRSLVITITGEDRVITLPASARCVVEHGGAR